MITREIRNEVRRRYNYCCGYCGVRETDVGGELEIDHFHPVSAGGSDELDNLVYCCAVCNRHKGSFWAGASPATEKHLLHPLLSDPAIHWREEEDGRLTALTETAAFHIARLKLNRPARIAMRLRRREEARKAMTDAALSERKRLFRYDIDAAADYIRRLFADIDRLSGGG